MSDEYGGECADGFGGASEVDEEFADEFDVYSGQTTDLSK